MSRKKRMSERQLAANRANAQKSTGPRTEEGKRQSRLNSLVHGLRSQELLLPGEDATALDELRASFLERFQPSGPAELFCVEKMLQSYWRSRRVPILEAGLFRRTDATVLDGFARLSRYEASLDRAFYKALAELRALKSENGFARQPHIEAAADRGTVSHNAKAPPEAPAPANNGFARQTPTGVTPQPGGTVSSHAPVPKILNSDSLDSLLPSSNLGTVSQNSEADPAPPKSLSPPIAVPRAA